MSRASTRAGSPRAGRIGVAVIGFGWMGSVHTRAYVRLPHNFPQLALRADLIAVAGEVPGRAEQAADQFGFTTATNDWRDVAADQRVGAVSVIVPNYLHRQVGTAIAAAGKHLWIEKPVGLTSYSQGASGFGPPDPGLQLLEVALAGPRGLRLDTAPGERGAGLSRHPLLIGDAGGDLVRDRYAVGGAEGFDPASAIWRFRVPHPAHALLVVPEGRGVLKRVRDVEKRRGWSCHVPVDQPGDIISAPDRVPRPEVAVANDLAWPAGPRPRCPLRARSWPVTCNSVVIAAQEPGPPPQARFRYDPGPAIGARFAFDPAQNLEGAVCAHETRGGKLGGFQVAQQAMHGR